MKITFVLPAIGKKQGRKYLRSWLMEPLTIAVLKPGMTAFLVTGDAARNKIQTMPGGGTATIKIELPANWNELMAKLGYEPLSKFELDASLIPPPSKTPSNESAAERRRQGGSESNPRRSGKGKSRNRQGGSYDRRDRGGQGDSDRQYRRRQNGGERGDRQGRGGQFGGRGGRGGGAMQGRRGGASAEPPKELVNDRNLRRLEFSSRNGELKYCEFLENGDTEGPMSLVLLMHGLSNSGDDNLRQLAMPAIKPLLNYLRRHKIKALVLIPQCPKDKSWIRDRDILEVLHDLVESKRKKYGISYSNSIISGFSMGGGGCFSYMMRHPKVFRKAILVSAGGRAARPDKLRGEFYIAVGSKDRFVSPDNSEKFARELSRKNKVRFEMPDLDHIETAQKIYSGDCWDWAFDRKRSE